MKDQIKVLLVEDNPDQVRLVRFSLEDYPKYHLDVAMTGKEALENATKDQFDVIFLDYRLPDINLLDVLRHLRKLHEKTGNYIPIIMITGEGSEVIAIESMHSGAFDYIVKSVNYYSLIPQVLNDLEQNYTSNFEMDDIHVIVFKKRRFGPEVYLSTSLPFKNDPAQILP